MTWRDHLKIHPAAELFPLMSEDELRELGQDIKKNGLHSPIVLMDGTLLDGRNRLDAMELVGLKFEFRRDTDRRFATNQICVLDIEGSREPSVGNGIYRGLRWIEPEDAYDYVISANLHRRHLTSEQKRDLIANVVKAKPEASNATVAKQTKTTDKTVAKVRRKLESTSEIPKLNKTVGADGKSRPKTKKIKKSVKKVVDPYAVGDACIVAALEAEARASGSAEISADDRRAYYAETENAKPAEPADEVDRRVSCVANTILCHVEGLSRGDAERFFTALRDRLDDLAREQLRDWVAESRSEHEISGDLRVPDFLRRAPA